MSRHSNNDDDNDEIELSQSSDKLDANTASLLKVMTENNFDATVASTEAGEIIEVNSVFLHLFGYVRHQIIGRNISILIPAHHSGGQQCSILRYVRSGVKRNTGKTIANLVACKENGGLFPMALKINEWQEGSGARIFFATIHPCDMDRRLKRCQGLLEQMLPPDAIETMLSETDGLGSVEKNANSHMASNYVCSVGCVNLLKFTRNAANMSTLQLAALISHIYSEFDSICQKFGMEPLKTIGGCYMFTSKRTNFASDHAVKANFTALECIQAIRQRKIDSASESETKFDVKVGIATGSVSFALIKSRKLTYDAWGLTVNMATHLSALAPTNGILVSKQTFLEARGERNLHFEGPVRGITKGDVAAADNNVQAYSVWNSDEVPLHQQMSRCCAILDDVGMATNSHMKELYDFLVQQNIQPRQMAYDESFDVETFSFIMICVRPPFISGTEACRRLRTKKNCPPCALLITSEFDSMNLCEHYNAIGVGQEACFEIPFSADKLQPWLAKQKEPMHTRRKMSEVRRASAEKLGDQSSPRTTVLIVDDVAVNILLARKLFSIYGKEIDVVSATDARQAIALVKNTAISLCLVDVRMPNLDGIDFTEILRQSFNDVELPIVGLTSADDIDNLTRCYDVGMNDVLYKPLDAVRLRALIERWLPHVRLPTHDH